MSEKAKKDEKKDEKKATKEKYKCAHCTNDLPTNAQKCGFCNYKICNKCDATNCPKK